MPRQTPKMAKEAHAHNKTRGFHGYCFTQFNGRKYLTLDAGSCERPKRYSFSSYIQE